MSHTNGHVTFKDGYVLHGEYNGTSDVFYSALYETHVEVSDNWRNHEHIECSCGKDEEVEIHSDYGGGMDWEGRACRHCMCITKNRIPTFYQYDDDDYLRYY